MSKPGRPSMPDELKRVHYSSTMAPDLIAWLRNQPEPMTKIIDRLVGEYRDRVEGGDDIKLVDDIKTLIKKSRVTA